MKIPEPRKLKSGKWFIQLRLDHKSIPVSDFSKKECIRKAALEKAEYLSGKEKKVTNGITLEKAVDIYITKRVPTLSPSTVRGYRIIQRNYFQDEMKQALQDIDWQEAVSSLAKNHKPKTVKNAWRFVGSVLRENKLPVPNISLPAIPAAERRFLSSDEILDFVKLVQGQAVEIPALLALHSLRRSEIAALDWNDIDLKGQNIRVHGSAVQDEDNVFIHKQTTKNESSTRTIPIMIPELAAALEAVEDKTGPVCRMHPNSIYKAVNTICAANGLPAVGVHGLRHSFASLAYKIGLTEKQTMELGGWADFGTMRKIYTHLDNQSKEESRSKFLDFFANQNANKSAKH